MHRTLRHSGRIQPNPANIRYCFLKFNFFSRTAPTQTNKDICTGITCADPGIFVRGSGGGGGPGSSTYFTVYRGAQWFYYTFSRGGVHFFPGGGGPNAISIETHIHVHVTITCDFPGGSGPLSTSGSQMYNVAFWHE